MADETRSVWGVGVTTDGCVILSEKDGKTLSLTLGEATWIRDRLGEAIKAAEAGAVRRPSTGRHRGKGNPRARLTEAQVYEIRAAYVAGGHTHRSLSAQYGVTPATIGAIVTRRIWSHLPEAC